MLYVAPFNCHSSVLLLVFRLTHRMGVVLSGVRGRCQSDLDFDHRQLHRWSAPWGAYSAGPWSLLHIPRVFCVQLSEEKKVKVRRWWDTGCFVWPFHTHPMLNVWDKLIARLTTSEIWAATLTGFTLVIHMEVFGSSGARVFPKQQVIDRQLAISVALTLWKQLLHNKQQGRVSKV